MIYCAKCGKEAADNVEKCPDCGSIVFSDIKLEIRRKKRKERIKKSLFRAFIFLSLCVILKLSNIFGDDIYYFSQNYPIINIGLVTAYFVSLIFFFRRYFTVRKTNWALFLVMFSIVMIFRFYKYWHSQYTTYNVVLSTVFTSIYYIVIAITLYGNLSKRDFINHCLYGALLLVMADLLVETPFIFKIYRDYNNYYLLYGIARNILNLFLVLLIMNFINKRTYPNNNIYRYIYVINAIYIVNIIMATLLHYHDTLIITRQFTEFIRNHMLINIILNTALFFSISRGKKVAQYHIKLGTALSVFFCISLMILGNNLFVYRYPFPVVGHMPIFPFFMMPNFPFFVRIETMPSEEIMKQNIIITLALLAGTMLPLVLNIVLYIRNKRIDSIKKANSPPATASAIASGGGNDGDDPA